MFGLESRAFGEAVRSWAPRPAWRAARATSPTLTVSLARLLGDAPSETWRGDTLLGSANFATLERRYGTSAPVYACVRRKGRDLASAPLRVSQTNADGTVAPALADDPLARLLAHPNPWMSGAQLVYLCSMFLDLTGNYFLLVLRDRENVPRMLYPVNPAAVTIRVTSTALVAGYELLHYGQSIPLRAYGPDSIGDLIHFKLDSPLPSTDSAFPSPWGIGPLEAAWTLVLTEDDATKSNRNLAKNDGRPVAMLTTEQSISNEIAEEAKQRWLKNYGGPAQAGQIAVLGAGMKYQQLAFSPKDLDYLPTRKELWREIIALFDLNGTVLGFTEGDVGRRDEQLRDYWQATIMSTSRTDICAPLNTRLAPEFGAAYVVDQDFSRVPALRPNWPALAPAVGALVDRGVPMRIVNDALDLGLPAWDGWDRAYVSASLVPADQAGAPIGLPPAPDEDEVVV